MNFFKKKYEMVNYCFEIFLTFVWKKIDKNLSIFFQEEYCSNKIIMLMQTSNSWREFKFYIPFFLTGVRLVLKTLSFFFYLEENQ